MAFAIFGKKNTEKISSCGCACAGNRQEQEETSATTPVCNEITSIKVLGTGCKACHDLFENAEKAVAEMGLSVKAEYITDMAQVMEYGVMHLPALVVNEQVISMGKSLKPKEITALLKK